MSLAFILAPDHQAQAQIQAGGGAGGGDYGGAAGIGGGGGGSDTSNSNGGRGGDGGGGGGGSYGSYSSSYCQDGGDGAYGGGGGGGAGNPSTPGQSAVTGSNAGASGGNGTYGGGGGGGVGGNGGATVNASGGTGGSGGLGGSSTTGGSGGNATGSSSYGGGGGGGGAGSVINNTGAWSSGADYTGGQGGNGYTSAYWVGGGGGGAALVLTGDGVQVTIDANTIKGGAGGTGDDAGGGGGVGLVLYQGNEDSTITVTSTGSIIGGAGSTGGDGGAGVFMVGYGGGTPTIGGAESGQMTNNGVITGGAGYTGGAGVLANNGQIINKSTITGGSGSYGGNGVQVWYDSAFTVAGVKPTAIINTDVIIGGAGSSRGGTGAWVTNSVIENSGQITGGASTSAYDSHDAGTGARATNGSIINYDTSTHRAGTITGGISTGSSSSYFGGSGAILDGVGGLLDNRYGGLVAGGDGNNGSKGGTGAEIKASGDASNWVTIENDNGTIKGGAALGGYSSGGDGLNVSGNYVKINNAQSDSAYLSEGIRGGDGLNHYSSDGGNGASITGNYFQLNNTFEIIGGDALFVNTSNNTYSAYAGHGLDIKTSVGGTINNTDGGLIKGGDSAGQLSSGSGLRITGANNSGINLNNNGGYIVGGDNTLSNTSTSIGAAGGAGIYVSVTSAPDVFSSFNNNQGEIRGGASSSLGGKGGDGISINSSTIGAVINNTQGLIAGGDNTNAGGTAAGGAGINMSTLSTIGGLVNSGGAILGGNAAGSGSGGIGANLYGNGADADNRFVVNNKNGLIQGGDSESGSGGVGLSMNSGYASNKFVTVNNSGQGIISGGASTSGAGGTGLAFHGDNGIIDNTGPADDGSDYFGIFGGDGATSGGVGVSINGSNNRLIIEKYVAGGHNSIYEHANAVSIASGKSNNVIELRDGYDVFEGDIYNGGNATNKIELALSDSIFDISKIVDSGSQSVTDSEFVNFSNFQQNYDSTIILSGANAASQQANWTVKKGALRFEETACLTGKVSIEKDSFLHVGEGGTISNGLDLNEGFGLVFHSDDKALTVNNFSSVDTGGSGPAFALASAPSQWVKGQSYAMIEMDNDTYFAALDGYDLNVGRFKGQLNFGTGGDADTLYLDVVSTGLVAPYGETYNQRNTAKAVDELALNGEIQTALGNVSDEDLPKALDELSGVLHPNAHRMFAMQGTGFTKDVLNVAANRSEKANGQPNFGDGDINPNLWISLSGSRSTMDADGNAPKVTADSRNLSFGSDMRFYDGWLAGLAFRLGDQEIESGKGTADSKDISLALYAGREIPVSAGKLRLIAGTAYSWHDIDTRRTVLGAKRHASYNADSWQIFAEAALGIQINDRTIIEPYLNANWIQVESDSFAEDTGLGSIRVKAQENDNFFTTLGARLDFQASDCVSLSAGLGWQHAFGDREWETSMEFQEGGGPFAVRSAPLAENSALVELGANFAVNEYLHFNLRYDGAFGDDSDRHSGTGTISINW